MKKQRSWCRLDQWTSKMIKSLPKNRQVRRQPHGQSHRSKSGKTSKAMVGNPKFGFAAYSVIDNKKIATKHNVKVRKNNVKARDTADSLIVRPKTPLDCALSISCGSWWSRPQMSLSSIPSSWSRGAADTLKSSSASGLLDSFVRNQYWKIQRFLGWPLRRGIGKNVRWPSHPWSTVNWLRSKEPCRSKNHQNDHSDPCQAAMQGPFWTPYAGDRTKRETPDHLRWSRNWRPQHKWVVLKPYHAVAEQIKPSITKAEIAWKHCTKGLAPNQNGARMQKPARWSHWLGSKAIESGTMPNGFLQTFGPDSMIPCKIIRVLRWTLFLAKM